MTVVNVNGVPPLLHGQDFLSSSHYRISCDERFTPNALKSTFQNDYIPLRDVHKPEAALPPKPSNFIHKDEEKINMKVTETCRAFPAKQSFHDDKRNKYDSLYRTNFRMDSDDRMSEFNTTHEHYYKPKSFENTFAPKLARVGMKSQFPQGDNDKRDNPISNYRENFKSYGCMDTKTLFPHKCVQMSSLRGDNARRFETTHSANFNGSWVLPPRAVPKHTASSIPEGDRENDTRSCTTMRDAFKENQILLCGRKSSNPYKKLYATNFKVKDDLEEFNQFHSTTAESYSPISIENVSRYRRDRDRNASDIPVGDKDWFRGFKRINSTVTRSSHKCHAAATAVPRVDGAKLRTVSNVQLGEKGLSTCFYKTTCDSTYSAVPVPPKRSPAYIKSCIPIDQFGHLEQRATSWGDFQTHDAKQLKLHDSGLTNLYKTHFTPPLGDKRYFLTNHDFQYMPKTCQRIFVDPGRLQRSSVPIGTLGNFIEGCHNVCN